MIGANCTELLISQNSEESVFNNSEICRFKDDSFMTPANFDQKQIHFKIKYKIAVQE